MQSSDPESRQGSFYIQIEPNITVGLDAKKQIIPLDAIRCQTVLSKCLGPLSTWENKLIVSKNTGYNMIHFTPVQVRFITTYIYVFFTTRLCLVLLRIVFF